MTIGSCLNKAAINASLLNVRFDILTVVTMKTTTLFDVTLGSLVDVKNRDVSKHPLDCPMQHLLAYLPY